MACPAIKNMLQNLKVCDRDKQCLILKKMASTIQYSNKEDLQAFLDFINTLYDLELQNKLFSILSIYLICNGSNINIIITYNALYDAIDRIISKKLPRKTSVVINFLTLLLQSNCIENYSSRRNSLYMYAQNQIRVSGCLSTMADIFMSGMMYQDTWRALCRCLAETYNNSEQNQNYCTYLIPKCVKLCSLRNMETYPVLQSLIYKNKRNVQLFLECDGMSLFKSELLQYETSLQLLNAVVETSTEATLIAQDRSILQYVHDMIRLGGPYTPTGQWATVILYHADMKIKEHKINLTENERSTHNKMSVTSGSNYQTVNDISDTILFRNVIKEIVQWNTNERDIYKNIFVNNITKDEKLDQTGSCWYVETKKCNERPCDFYSNLTVKNTVCPQRNSLCDELSFSFLNKNFRDTNKDTLSNRDEITNKCYKLSQNLGKTLNDRYGKNRRKKSPTVVMQSTSQLNISEFYKEPKNYIGQLDLKEFKPDFVSTPKHSKTNFKKIQKPSEKIRKVNTLKENLYNTVIRKFEADKSLHQTSIKARIFNAINQSCTAVMNSLTSILKSKSINHNVKGSKSQSKDEDIDPCSYSFTEYMRKRDAVYSERIVHPNTEQNFSVQTASCGSCNNTEALKLKMLNDNFLKETVRKLKIGINTYGCDFKKISNIMWPNEAYMSPNILYNLYRKLIMK